MPDFAGIQNTKRELIRKSLQGGVFTGPTSVPALTRITGPTGELIDLSATQYVGAGLLTADGISHARESASSDVTSFGQQEPSRTDITSDVTTVTFAAQETKLQTIGLATGVELNALVPFKGGEVVVRKPRKPSPRTYRVLTLAVDLNEAGEIYIGKFFPKAKVSSFSDQVFSSGDEALLWGVTLTGQYDDALGYSEQWHFGGPGWNALLLDMGFLPAATA